jgi:hypothetical protein
MSGGREIDDRQTAMDQRRSGFAVDPDAFVVRSAMRKARGHLRGSRVDVAPAAGRCSADEACNAAHRNRSALMTDRNCI